MKGITPLLATVLLVSTVFIIGLLVTSWLGTLTRQTTEQASNKTTEATQCASAGISIEDVYLRTPNITRVIIRNSGQADNLNVIGATVFNTTGHSATTAGPSDFDKGNVTTITVESAQATLNFSSCPAAFSKVIVTTNCGGISDEFVGTPRCS